MTRFAATEPFDSNRHRVDDFSCGQPPLDAWLRAYAGQSQRRDAARTFVTASDAGTVLGFYTLVAAQVEHASATADVRRGMSKHFPIPVALLARLAVNGPSQGRGLGRSLLLDTLRRVTRASNDLAVRAVTVDAMDEHAAAFYRRFGFQASALGHKTLMVSLQVVRRVVDPPRGEPR